MAWVDDLREKRSQNVDEKGVSSEPPFVVFVDVFHDCVGWAAASRRRSSIKCLCLLERFGFALEEVEDLLVL